MMNKMFFLVFQAQPLLPPSPAQAVQREVEHSENFFQSVKRLIFNSGYLLLLFSYAINVGVFYAISTMLNEIVLQHFPVCMRFNKFLCLFIIGE